MQVSGDEEAVGHVWCGMPTVLGSCCQPLLPFSSVRRVGVLALGCCLVCREGIC